MAGLGSPAVMTSVQESVYHAQALQTSLVCVDNVYRPSGLGSPMMSFFVSLGRYLSDHSTSVWMGPNEKSSTAEAQCLPRLQPTQVVLGKSLWEMCITNHCDQPTLHRQFDFALIEYTG